MTDETAYKEKIFRFLQGNLSEEEETELLAWIKAGGEVRKKLFRQQQSLFREQIVQQKNRQTDRQWEKLSFKLEDYPFLKLQSGHQRPVPVRWVMSVAAAFILGLVISSLIYFTGKNLPQNGLQVQEVSVPYGARTNFMLPDGSTAWLNSGSTLSFPAHSNGDRTVNLKGEAYFDVVKNGTPFTVSTVYGKIEVLGTSFNVKAYSDGEFESTLVEGSVKVNGSGNHSLALIPGQQAYLDEQGELNIRKVDPEVFTSWKEGKLIFYREPFAKMAKRLERWYNVTIEVNDEEMKDLWFTGTIEMETLSEVMDLISRTMPVQYDYNQKIRALRIYKK
ncbi:MAG: FecR domain-containing protein [Prolixibacteraceae bacterium]